MKYLVAVLVLVGCGKDYGVSCSVVDSPTAILSFGTFEAAKCPPGEFALSYTPIHAPGVDQPISIDVQCAKKVQVCGVVKL